MPFSKRAISTSSLGLHPSHTLTDKLHCAAAHNFNGIEIVHSDLEIHSTTHNIPILAAAHQIRSLCSTLNLHILSLCPFENYEGHPTPLPARLEKAKEWIETARALGASYLQVPASYAPNATGSLTTIVSELRQLTDLGTAQEPHVSIAYEPMSWSTHVSTWQDALHIATLVNRPTFKICLDTFHLATALWASPYTTDGKVSGADERLKDDLCAFEAGFPREKLAYLQVSDAARFDPPFSARHPWAREAEAVEFSWSKHGRPFPGEREFGAYLPLGEIVGAWTRRLGEGWVGLETFDWRMRDAGVTVDECARRAERAWGWLESQVGGGVSKL